MLGYCVISAGMACLRCDTREQILDRTFIAMAEVAYC